MKMDFFQKDKWKRKNHLLAAVLVGCMGVLSACSEDETLPGTDGNDTEKVVVNNDMEELNKRVSLYSRGAAAPKGVKPEWDQPGYMDEAADMMDKNFNEEAPEGKYFKLNPGDKKSVENLNLSGKEWFIYGDLELNGYHGKGKVYVMDGGKLSLPADGEVKDIEIHQYEDGKVALRSQDLKINSNAIITINGNYKVPGAVTTDNGQICVYGTLEVGKMDGLGLQLYAENLYIDQNSTVEQSYFYVNEKLTAKKMELVSGATVTVGCSAVMDELYMTANAAFNALDYLKSDMTTIDTEASINVNGGGLLQLGNFTNDNAATASVNVLGETYAVVDASQIHADASDLTKAFTGFMGLHYKTMQPDKNVKLQSQILVNGDDDTYIPQTECHPAYEGGSQEPTEPEAGDTKIVVEHIGSIESPDHAHNLSATCVQMVGANVYVSYHQQGAGYSGCAEVFTFNTPETFQLRSFMRSETSRDFNHLLVDGNTFYLVGGEQNKGAFLASIPLGNGIFGNGNADELSVVRITGDDKGADDDANCIVRNGNYYQVASNRGFRTLDASTKEILYRKNTDGSGKFIHLSNGKLATLNLTQRGVEDSGAEINVYNAADYAFDNPESTIGAFNITPIDGKNVCMVDGNDVYVCCGKNGLKRYTNGVLNGEFKRSGDALVNGMAYDDKYVYVAYGNRGLWVLDKQNLEKVANYAHGAGSANYVVVSGGYIYVAYGTSGLEVFRMAEVPRG